MEYMYNNIKLENKIINDKYTNYIYQKFDIQNTEKTQVEIPTEKLKEIENFNWNIGLIYGGSGSGKSTILSNIGNIKEAKFDKEKPLISNFNWLEPKEACRLLSSMGLSTVPAWLRPYKLLSNGEQYRAQLAWLVSKSKDGEIILIDEFTSVVDRDVAKSMSYALQKYIKKVNKKIILASVNYDIIDWLLPDWVYNLEKGGALVKGDCLRQSRPKINLQIYRTENDTWDIFKKHHYLTSKVSKSCKFFLFTWNKRPVGINAVIAQPSGHFKNGVRESRIVVLPEFQGLGLGYKISEFTAAIFKNNGYRYFTKTIHPALGNYRNTNSEKWRPTSKNGKNEKAQNQMGKLNGWSVLTRTSYCHEYIGNPIGGYDDLIIPTNDIRIKKKMNYS